MNLRRSILILILTLPVAAAAQTPAPYQPGLGDLMDDDGAAAPPETGTRRPGEELALCHYEGHELEEAFERIAKQVPKWRDLDIGQLIGATVKQPLDDLEAAVKASDGQRFDAAYRQLTDAAMPATRAPTSA